jgi:Flp pilus assembly protein TadG
MFIRNLYVLRTKSAAVPRAPQRRGVAAVEMACVLPLFIVITLGIVEFGRAHMVAHLLANAARFGTRQAILDGSTNSSVEKAVKDLCVNTLRVAAEKVTVDIAVGGSTVTPLSTAAAGGMCAVTVSVDFDDVSYLPGGYLRGQQLSNTCTMEHE